MNKNAIKIFAISARNNLISAVKNKAFEYGIDENGYGESRATVIGDRPLSNTEIDQRSKLIQKINSDGFKQVMEEVAYTWFNRFIALRYMEVNRYLPSRIRVFTNELGEFDPEILKRVDELDFIAEDDKPQLYDFIENSDRDGLYKFLIIAQCNALHTLLPCMFEPLSDYTELLFPSNLLLANSMLADMVNTIPEEDWREQVQIIGWLYQFYNSELKDETYAELKKKAKLTKEKIPAVTQLFTPDWIVRYMVENSLGRLWVEGHPDEAMKSEWKYYLEEAEQEAEVQAQLDAIRAEYTVIKPEEIKVMDPSMGSGHILVYAFDVLMQIYLSQGWSERDAAKSIVENNLYGIDIDERAYQLAYFAVMMKARSFSRKILTQDVKCNLCAIRESNDFDTSSLSLFGKSEGIAKRLLEEFIDAKEYGSILIIKTPLAHLIMLRNQLAEIKNREYENLFDRTARTYLVSDFEPLLNQAIALAQKYDVVITNPPYIGRKNCNSNLTNFLDKNFPESKMDLFAAFLQKNIAITKENGFAAYMTPFVWLFLSSYSSLRESLIDSNSITSFVQPEESSFKDAAVTICSFVIRKSSIDYNGKYVKLSDYHDFNEQSLRLQEVASGKLITPVFNKKMSVFKSFPDNRIVYWTGEGVSKAFSSSKALGEVCQPRQGMATTNNDLFLRLWFELEYNRIGYSYDSEDSAELSGFKWFPYNKGGGFRKWYGNFEYCVNYENRGKTICDYIDSTPGARVGSNGRVINRQYFFKKSITWSDICGSSFAARSCPKGFVFDVKGSSGFVNDELYNTIIGYLNSKVSTYLLNTLNPTVTTQVGDLKQLPFVLPSLNNNNKIREIVNSQIQLSKIDWDSFETSWDFKKHPLI